MSSVCHYELWAIFRRYSIAEPITTPWMWSSTRSYFFLSFLTLMSVLHVAHFLKFLQGVYECPNESLRQILIPRGEFHVQVCAKFNMRRIIRDELISIPEIKLLPSCSTRSGEMFFEYLSRWNILSLALPTLQSNLLKNQPSSFLYDCMGTHWKWNYVQQYVGKTFYQSRLLTSVDRISAELIRVPTLFTVGSP